MKGSLEKFQKKLYLQMKKKAQVYLGEDSKDLKHYKKNLKKYISGEFELSSARELLKSLGNSNVTYLGDFHTFDQGSKNLERLLKSLSSKKNLILAVEFVKAHHQAAIEYYLNGYITELEFLDEIEYSESWKFPWPHYKRFFSLAKDHHLKIIGLNSVGPLKERDINAAKIISKILSTNPKDKILCIFGEYHIAPNKLPALVERFFKKKLTQTIIYQNSEDIYWKLVKMKSSSQDVIVKFNDHQFSLQNSPPWTKYESLIYWYENILDDPDFDIHNYVLTKGLLVSTKSSEEQFSTLLEYLKKYLKEYFNMNITSQELQDFNFYDYQGVDYIKEQIKRLKPQKLKSLFIHKIEKGKSFFIPHTNIYFTPGHSITKISWLVGFHLLKSLRKTVSLDSLDCMLKKYNQSSLFFFFLINYSFTYIISKIINPYRKCELYLDLQNITTKNIIDLAMNKKSLVDILAKLTPESLETEAKIIGKILGENIYLKIKNNKMGFTLLEQIYMQKEYSNKNYNNIFKQSLPLNYKNQKKRFF